MQFAAQDAFCNFKTAFVLSCFSSPLVHNGTLYISLNEFIMSTVANLLNRR